MYFFFFFTKHKSITHNKYPDRGIFFFFIPLGDGDSFMFRVWISTHFGLFSNAFCALIVLSKIYLLYF